MKQHFFVGKEYLGCRGIPHHTRTVEGNRVTSSYVYFCSHCGEVWGKLLHEAPNAYTQLTIRPCLRHSHHGWGGYLSSPASWGETPTSFARDWPSAAIRWEFNVYMHHLESGEERFEQYPIPPTPSGFFLLNKEKAA